MLSEWEYYNSDHAFIAGKKAAAALRQGKAQFQVQDLKAKRKLLQIAAN
jgi:hypothetical protein